MWHVVTLRFPNVRDAVWEILKNADVIYWYILSLFKLMLLPSSTFFNSDYWQRRGIANEAQDIFSIHFFKASWEEKLKSWKVDKFFQFDDDTAKWYCLDAPARGVLHSPSFRFRIRERVHRMPVPGVRQRDRLERSGLPRPLESGWDFPVREQRSRLRARI